MKKNRLFRLEGKDYMIKEADIVYFRFNAWQVAEKDSQLLSRLVTILKVFRAVRFRLGSETTRLVADARG